MHMTTFALIIIQGMMKNTAIIPHGERTIFPLEASYKSILGQVLGKKAKHCQAFFTGPALDSMGMRLAAEDTLSASLCMGSNQGMLNF